MHCGTFGSCPCPGCLWPSLFSCDNQKCLQIIKYSMEGEIILYHGVYWNVNFKSNWFKGGGRWPRAGALRGKRADLLTTNISLRMP